MAKYKRTTTKIGPNTRKTITHSKAGTRITISNKPSKSAPRTTISTNLNTGNRRITTSRKLGGGWWDRTTRSKNTIYKSKTISRKPSSTTNSDSTESILDLIDTSNFKWWQKSLWYMCYPFLFIFIFLFGIAVTILFVLIKIAFLIGLVALLIWLLSVL
jgi:hypothetical protein